MTDNSEPVIFGSSGAIGTITINKPDSLNAMDLDVANGFLKAAKALAADEKLRVIILEAAGRSFMAGGDLNYFRTATDRGNAARELIRVVHDALRVLAGASQITISSIKGAAAGGGMSLALGLDLAIAADNAVFNAAYTRIGTTPDTGGSWVLPRLVGMRKAMEIALLCDNIPAEEALRLGLVNKVVPLDRLESETGALAERLAAGAPLAQRNTKQLMAASWNRSLEDQLEAEIDSFAECADTSDFAGAVEAFFNKTTHKFEGR